MPRKALSTVLARVAIARIDVDAAEADVPLGHLVKRLKQDDTRYPDPAPHDADAFVLSADGELRPRVEVERLVLLVHRFRDALIQKRERSPRRRDVNRQVRAIQNQYGRVQHRKNLPESTT